MIFITLYIMANKVEKKYNKLRERAEKNLVIPEPPKNLNKLFFKSFKHKKSEEKHSNEKNKLNLSKQTNKSSERSGFFSKFFSFKAGNKEPSINENKSLKRWISNDVSNKTVQKLNEQLQKSEMDKEILKNQIEKFKLLELRETEIKDSEKRILLELKKLDELKKNQKSLEKLEEALNSKEKKLNAEKEQIKTSLNNKIIETEKLNIKRDQIKKEITKLTIDIRVLQKEQESQLDKVETETKRLNELEKEASKHEEQMKKKEKELASFESELKLKEKSVHEKEHKIKQDFKLIEESRKETKTKLNTIDKILKKLKKTKINEKDIHEIKSALFYGENINEKTIGEHYDEIIEEQPEIIEPTGEIKEPKHAHKKEEPERKTKYSSFDDMINVCKQLAKQKKIKDATKLYNQIRHSFYKMKFSHEDEKTKYYNELSLLYDEINLASL